MVGLPLPAGKLPGFVSCNRAPILIRLQKPSFGRELFAFVSLVTSN